MADIDEDPEARRERLIANGYKTDSRCTWLAIGRCPECGRIHDGAVKKSVRYCAWQQRECPVPNKCIDAGRCLNVVSFHD